jgi:hypothetical protein
LSLNLPGAQIPKRVKNAADAAMENFTICTARRIENRKDIDDEEVTVNLNNICDGKYRSFGSEFVLHSIWEELKMPQKLKELGFSPKERSLAEGMVAGRLIEPSSELATWGWLKNNSSIGDLTEASLENVGLSSVYKIGDKLLKHKTEIEEHLFSREQKLYPGRETLYLFDLTNNLR